MTEPIAREERLRMRQSGRKTKMERSTIMKLLLASSAGPPTSFPMEAKLSPTMIE
jgi:predicted DNA-binding transcriptional regulator AlpA